MGNNIDKVITLDDDSRYMILDQGNYNGKSYYLTSKLDKDDYLTEDFNIFEHNDDLLCDVQDEKVFNALVDYFKKRFQN